MIRIYNLVLVSMLPFVYGCLSGGGGGSSASAGSVVGGGSFSGGGEGIGTGAGGGLETIHNPEPATMLLVGGGVAAMAYYRNLRK